MRTIGPWSAPRFIYLTVALNGRPSTLHWNKSPPLSVTYFFQQSETHRSRYVTLTRAALCRCDFFLYCVRNAVPVGVTARWAVATAYLERGLWLVIVNVAGMG